MATLVGGMRGPVIGPGYYAGYRHQRGGGFWSKALSAAIIPALKFLGKKAAGTAAEVLTDVSEGQNIQESVKSRVAEQGKKLVSSAADRALKFAQTGRGRRKLKGGKRKIKGGRKQVGGRKKLSGKGNRKTTIKGGRRQKGGKKHRGGNKMKGKGKNLSGRGMKKIKNKSISVPAFLK